MKTFTRISLALLMITATALHADEPKGEAKTKPEREKPKTLFTGDNLVISGYGALQASSSKVGDKYGIFAGGRGAVLLNENWALGLSGYGLAYPTRRDTISGSSYAGTEPYVSMGYGGFLLEYHFAPKQLFHVAIGTTIGGGSLMYRENNRDDRDDRDHQGDKFFAVEPEVTLYVNVSRFCRVGAGVSYRYINGISSSDLKDKDFSGPSASVIAAFGWF